MRTLVLLASLAGAVPATAETLVAARTIRAKAVIEPNDLSFAVGDVPGALGDPDHAIGLEARVVIYAGRPILPGDLTEPALIERNQVVPMIYLVSGLRIETEVRAMDRAGIGESIRAMNVQSRATVTGTVGPDGIIYVGGMPQ